MQVKFKEESMKDNNLNTNQEVSKDEKKVDFLKKILKWKNFTQKIWS